MADKQPPENRQLSTGEPPSNHPRRERRLARLRRQRSGEQLTPPTSAKTPKSTGDNANANSNSPRRNPPSAEGTPPISTRTPLRPKASGRHRPKSGVRLPTYVPPPTTPATTDTPLTADEVTRDFGAPGTGGKPASTPDSRPLPNAEKLRRAQTAAQANISQATSTPAPTTRAEKRAAAQRRKDQAQQRTLQESAKQPPEQLLPAASTSAPLTRAQRRTAHQKDTPATETSPTTTADSTPKTPRSFRRAAALTVASAILPGLGLLWTKKRAAGWMLLSLIGIGIVLAGLQIFSVGAVQSLAQFSTSTGLTVLFILIVLLALIWLVSILATAISTWNPRWNTGRKNGQRLLAIVLCAAVLAPTVQALRYVTITQETLTSVFGLSSNSDSRLGSGTDAWKNLPRVNVLLLGSDSGPGRVGVRTDSMILASVDTKTGNTTLISIPRALQGVPFPEKNPLHNIYPDGFDCPDRGNGNECLMDAIWTEAEVNYPHLFEGRDDYPNPGLDSTREVVQEITGLQVDYTVLVNLDGFRQLIDAMGGVWINVSEPVAIGGHLVNGQVVGIDGHIQPGYQRLNGQYALWYSRSRSETSDHDRMRRQRCMVNALIDQAKPLELLPRFPEIMLAAKENIRIDIHQDELPAFAQLAMKMKDGKMRSVNLSPPVIYSGSPDFAKIRQLVQDGIAGKTPAKPSSTPQPNSSSDGSSPSSTPTNDGSTNDNVRDQAIVDTKDAC